VRRVELSGRRDVTNNQIGLSGRNKRTHDRCFRHDAAHHSTIPNLNFSRPANQAGPALRTPETTQRHGPYMWRQATFNAHLVNGKMGPFVRVPE
jgi:hypothetical protein